MEPTDKDAAAMEWETVSPWKLWCHPRVWARQIEVERHCAAIKAEEVSQLNDQLVNIQNLMAEKESVMSQNNERIAQLEAQCSRQAAQIEMLDKRLQEALDLNNALKEDIEMVDNIVDRATQMRERYERRIALLRAKVIELREALRITDTSNPDDELAVIDMYEETVRKKESGMSGDTRQEDNKTGMDNKTVTVSDETMTGISEDLSESANPERGRAEETDTWFEWLP